jgi:diguanylate cyclase (GGDEF)-like protein
LAIHDELTSLYTKGYFLERLKEECKRGMRQNRVVSLLMLDIDYFKNYNDRLGHTAGDIVLQTLSHNIVDALKDLSPIISRFGGEEFCIVLPSQDKQKASAVAEQLRIRMEKTNITLRRQETNVTVSIGVASLPDDASDEDELVIKADRAMYEAKQKGRNRVCIA